MSALPKQVQKQIEEANRIAAQVYGNPETPPDPNAPPADPAPAPGEPAAPVPTPIPQESAEHKYKVLQGKYNAEVPRLQRAHAQQAEEVRQLRDQLTATQNLLASLGQRGEPAASPSNPPTRTKLVKDEEIKEFGADLYDFMKRVVREETQSEISSQVEGKVRPISQKVDQVANAATSVAQRVVKNDEQAVLDLLEEKVPNWLQLNEDEGFLQWLNVREPYTGVARGQLLTEAFKAHDGPRVVAFFNGYLTEHAAAVTPPANPQPSAAPAPPAAPPQALDRFVAPGASRPGPSNAPDVSGKRVWTRAEIAGFYAARSAGRFRSKPDEAKRLESDIFAAQREGRIR